MYKNFFIWYFNVFYDPFRSLSQNIAAKSVKSRLKRLGTQNVFTIFRLFSRYSAIFTAIVRVLHRGISRFISLPYTLFPRFSTHCTLIFPAYFYPFFALFRTFFVTSHTYFFPLYSALIKASFCGNIWEYRSKKA